MQMTLICWYHCEETAYRLGNVTIKGIHKTSVNHNYHPVVHSLHLQVPPLVSLWVHVPDSCQHPTSTTFTESSSEINSGSGSSASKTTCEPSSRSTSPDTGGKSVHPVPCHWSWMKLRSHYLTRMHSSRMRTTCFLPVSPSMHSSGGRGEQMIK